MSAQVEAVNAAIASGEDANDNKFLSFYLEREEYGVEILRVREIIGIIDITPLPQTPEFVKGVINLRGKIIPVIELRSKFMMPPVEYTEETCIIVVDVTDPETDDQFQMGVIVDTVSEVMDIEKDQIEPAPRFGCDINTDYIFGMGKTRDKVVILLDIDKVLTRTELTDLRGSREESSVQQAEAA
jgi:purine-binding chemotaxis protein CheW